MFRKRMYGGGSYANQVPYKKGRYGKTLNNKVTRLQRQVALLKPESKAKLTAMSISNITQAAGSISFLSGIDQGTTDEQRVGDSVRMQSIRVVGLFNPLGSVVHMRWFVVKDLDTNSSTPSIAGSSQSILDSFVPRVAYPLQATKKRFKILAEGSMTTQQEVNGFGGAPFFDTGKIKLNCVSTYVATGSTSASGGKNQFYFVVIVDGADTLDFNARSEIMFTDV